MKNHATALVLAATLSGCALFPKATVKDVAHKVIDLVLAQCVNENAWKDEKGIQEACHYANDLAPAVRELVLSARMGAKMGSADLCERK